MSLPGLHPMICQMAGIGIERLTCPVTDSYGFACEVSGSHIVHLIGRHTIEHARVGYYTCDAVAAMLEGHTG